MRSFHNYFALGVVAVTILSCGCSKSETVKPLPPDPTEQEKPVVKVGKFEISRGVNVGNWLSQTSATGDERARRFTEDDAKKLASYGFDHIRMPVDEAQLFSESGEFDKETLKIVHNAISWCKKYGLRVIFDMHDLRTHKCVDNGNTFWDVPQEQDKLVNYWSKILTELEQYPSDLVAYEMMNEPIAPSSHDWNVLANRIIRLIRQKNAERTIVFGSNRWEIPSEIPNLDIPSGDKHIILEFHYYQPMLLTHYKASWDKFANLELPRDLVYPGYLVPDELYNALNDSDKALVEEYRKTYDKSYFLGQWKKAIDFAKSKGLQLYLGEFGCLPYAGGKNRLAWVSDMVSLCKENGIAYSYWEYNGEFGFAERGTGKLTNQELLDILTR